MAATAASISAGRDPQAVGGQGQPVEARGVVDQRRVAAGADVGDDRGDGGVDALGGLPRLAEQSGEGGGEAGIGGGKAVHARLSAVGGLKSRAGRAVEARGAAPGPR